jgi:guanylate kinase
VKRDRQLAYSVSATTRPRRRGEVHGASYFFYSEPEFMKKVRQGALLEHAQVYGCCYGTPKAQVLRNFRQGRDVIADLDVQGMRSCKRTLPGTVGVFIIPPSRRELARRLRGRGTDSSEAVARREAELAAELAALPEFDYVVVNDRLENAVRDVMAIVRAERLRTARMAPLRPPHRPNRNRR